MTPTLELPEKPVEGLYYPTPVTPEEAFQAIGRLRKEARDAIDQLIQFLDHTDDYVSRELEDSADDNPHGEPSDDEPSLGAVPATNQDHWAKGNEGGHDCEGDGCADDREGDELEHGGDEHDGSEPDAEGEPSLGWTIDGCIGQTDYSGSDREAGATPTDAILRAREHYDPYRRQPNRDGMHVESERGWSDRKRLLNLSDRQREIVGPVLDRAAVTIS